MIHIAVAEDDEAYRNQIKKYIRQFETETGTAIEVSVFSDALELLNNYHAQYQIVILDIEMQYMDGMTAAERIRRHDEEVILMFITNLPQFAIRGYSVDALDYMLKPISYHAFTSRIQRAIAKIEKRQDHFITISVKGGIQKLEVGQIRYVESQGHHLIFHMSGDEHTTLGTMKGMEDELKNEPFFRGNKGCLINLKHVDAMRDGCAVIQDTLIPISRARKHDFLQALTEYLGDETA